MSQLVTINSKSGDYLAEHPEGGHVAYLYHSHELADEAINEMESPNEWQIKEISDLPKWLEGCRTAGITHIYELKSHGMSNIHQIHNFELFAQSSAGKQIFEE